MLCSMINDCVSYFGLGPVHSAGEIMSGFVQRLVPPLLVLASCAGSLVAQAAAPSPPFQIKVVVVTMFERGEDSGDTPGEFQLWVEHEHLDQILPLPAGYHHLRLNKDGVLGMVTRSGNRQGRRFGHGAGPRSAFRCLEGVL